MSAMTAMTMPAPTAVPLTALTIGLRLFTMLVMSARASWNTWRRTAASVAMSTHISRSPPAQKALSPAPVTTLARMRGSLSTSLQISPISQCIVMFVAFSFSGRFSVTSATPSAPTSTFRKRYLRA